MRPAGAAALCLVTLLPASSAGGTPDLESPVARSSYSLGHQIGSDLDREGKRPDPQALIRGLRDGLLGVEPALSRREIDGVLSDLKGPLMRRTRARRTHMAEGVAFLAANAERSGVVALPSGLQYEVLREGRGAAPGADSRVRIRYRSSLVDGTEFHDSYALGQSELVTVGRLIKGMAEALQRMGPGARWKLFVPPELAYGAVGPLAYRTVIIDVELEAIENVEGAKQRSSPAGSDS
jgi:FKBP-type peptidyl-prolyl cis-trans isomerase FklB